MKLTKLIAAVATIAIAAEVTRRIATELENRRMDAELQELFEWYEEDEEVGYSRNEMFETPMQKAKRERKEAIKALKAEQDYHLATIQYAIYEMQEPDVVKEAKARLIEIHEELESLK